ncbi:MAG: hypothetical protein U9Q15_00420 [Patescibacteria group bacterium]|nr:hypothetical protein [Patescibacteria group bacterium]
MKRFYIGIAIGCLVGAGFSQASAIADIVDTITKTKVYEIDMDTRITRENTYIDFDDYNIDPPLECSQPNFACDEYSHIKIITTKTWNVKKTEKINSSSLTTSDFAKYYPNLPDIQEINNLSDPDQKWIVQRILYERGLLPVFPTGNIGYETEKAIIKLQHIKGFEEFDPKRGISYIGPQTIKELNGLKDRMQDPEYIPNHPLPVVRMDDLGNNHKKRYQDITNRQISSGYMPNYDTSNQVEIVKPHSLRFSGGAKIEGLE